MFNVAIINLKDILKYLVSVIVIIIVITGVTRYFNDKKNTVDVGQKQVENLEENALICLDDTVPGIEYVNGEEDSKKDSSPNILESILKIELGMFEDTEDLESVEVASNNNENIISNEVYEEETIAENKIEEVQDNLQTEVVTVNPIADTYTNILDKVKIKNETSYEITADMFSNPLNLTNKNILIFHTHTCESYTSSEKYQYEQTGNYRTTDQNYSVVRVGEELKNYLTSFGYNVTHDTTYHDYPAYTGSYTRSLATVENLLKTQDAEIIIDLHRDAIGSNSNYAPTVKIGDEYAAQLMFVIGTDGGGLYHPNWKKNLQFAIEVQKKAEEMYPGLFKAIIVRNSRYNQHLGDAACIIEVGATGNTLDQCLVSQKYLAKVLDEVLK